MTKPTKYRDVEIRAARGNKLTAKSWLTEAALHPLTAGAARVIQLALPGIGRGMDAVTPVVDSSVRRGFSDDQALPRPQTGNTSSDTPAQ